MPRNRTLDEQFENQNCERCGYAFGLQLGQVSRSAQPGLCTDCVTELEAEGRAFDDDMPFDGAPTIDPTLAEYTPLEREQISYMRHCGVVLDPFGNDTPEEIRAALGNAAPEETLGDAA